MYTHSRNNCLQRCQNPLKDCLSSLPGHPRRLNMHSVAVLIFDSVPTIITTDIFSDISICQKLQNDHILKLLFPIASPNRN